MSSRPSDFLFKLIKSLTRAEKRYYKIAEEAFNPLENKITVHIFDAINNQDEYNDEALKKKFGNTFNTTNKSRVYDSILRSLDAFHANSSIDAQIKHDLHCAEILYKKGLYDQCAKLLMSTKKMAQKYERHSGLFEINLWEKKIIEKDNYSGKTEKDINSFLHDDLLIGEKVKNFNDYWNIKSRLFMILNKRGKVRNQEELANFKSIIDNTLLKTVESALSTETKYLFNHIYSAYYFGVGDYTNCSDFLKRNVDLIETNIPIFEEEPNIYFSVLTNIIYVSSQLKNYDDTFMYLRKLREVPQKFNVDKNEDMELKLFSSANSIEITIYNQLGEFERAIELVPKIELGLLKYADNLNKVRVAYFCSCIAIAYFGVAQYQQALKWNNKILNNKDIDDVEEAHCHAEMFNVIVHIELKNDKIIPYMLASAQRYLKNKKRVYKFENVFLNFVGKMIKEKNKAASKDLYQQFLDDINQLRLDAFESRAFEHFDYVSWAESKLSSFTFRDIVEQKAK
jgi:hypothetical protein